MDDFEREYKINEEKTVPFKLFGFNSTEELLNNIPDYAKVVHLAEEGLTLVLAVSDEKTLHVSKYFCKLFRITIMIKSGGQTSGKPGVQEIRI